MTPRCGTVYLFASAARRLLRPALTLLLVSLGAGARAEIPLPDLIDRVRPSIVGVGAIYPKRQPNRSVDPVLYVGTGFVVGNGRQIITNSHVVPEKLDVERNQKLAVFSGRGENARAHPARLVRRDKARDLALLVIDGTPLPALRLGRSLEVREGQSVAFTGFPIGAVLGLYPVTHTGIISAITPMARPATTSKQLTADQLKRLRNPFDVFQLDAVAYPGNSGSPVFELQEGRVIGVINSVAVKGSRESALSQPSGISYAIPARFVQKLLTGSP